MVEVNRSSRSQVSSGLLSQLLNPWRDTTARDNAARSNAEREEPKATPKAAPVASGVESAAAVAPGRPEADLAHIAHDLSIPISVIVGAAWSLKEECSSEDRQFWTDCILRNALCAQNRVEDLKDELLDANGLLEVKLTEMDLSSVVREAVEEFAPLAQDYDLQFYGDPACILGDAERIRRLAFSLLCNAINQSETGREIKVDVWRRGAQVCLFVQDQGKGPHPNQNEQVFLPFKNLTCGEADAASGAPTGDAPTVDVSILSSVQRIATAHGATVKVQGAPGHGTIYEVSFRALSLSQRREKSNDT